MRKLPEEENGVQHPRLDMQSAGACGPSDERRHRTRKSTGEDAQLRFAFEWRIHEQIAEQREDREQTRKRIDSGGKIDASRTCQHNSESQDSSRFQTASGEGAARGTAHLRVKVSFDVLV